MQTTTNKAQIIKVDLDTHAGELNKILKAFHESKVDLVANWAYEMGPDHAEAIFFPKDIKKTETVLTQLGFEPTTTWACYAEGTDQHGVYADLVNKVAEADINLTSTNAFATSGKFATMFFVNDEDFADLCHTLNCK